jgi:Arc/MetJ family transcription regulator
MRTTVRIDDRLLVEAKRRAAMSGRTLNELIEDALREAFARREGGRHRVELPVFRSARVMPGVDLDDGAALLDLMDGHDR